MTRHRSSAVPLAWGYVGLVGYASLYPFVGWRVPGVSPFVFLTLPWTRWWDTFDVIANLIGYLPLGLLAFFGMARGGARRWARWRSAPGCRSRWSSCRTSCRCGCRRTWIS